MVEHRGNALGTDDSPAVSKACAASLEGVNRRCHQESPLVLQEAVSCVLMHAFSLHIIKHTSSADCLSINPTFGPVF